MSSSNEKLNLKGININELQNYLKENQIKSFRAKQIFNWIYKNGVKSFEEMKNLPDELIKFLDNNVVLNNLKLAAKTEASDGTIKYLWELSDGNHIESVYLPYFNEGRHSVCISTQLGCNIGCKFCATGLSGLTRNLSTAEIMEQVLKIQGDIAKDDFLDPAITNVVFMGMGEPMNNLDNLLDAVNISNSDYTLNIGMRKMTISTAGVVPGIRELAVRNKQIGLAVSLNAPNDSLRDQVMPVNKKYPLSKLLEAVKEYIEVTKRRVTFEYIMIKNFNEEVEHAYQLRRLLSDMLCHVNLIPANPVPELHVKRAQDKKVEKFKEILNEANIDTTIRKERGVDIEAACGQLKRKEDEGAK